MLILVILTTLIGEITAQDSRLGFYTRWSVHFPNPGLTGNPIHVFDINLDYRVVRGVYVRGGLGRLYQNRFYASLPVSVDVGLEKPNGRLGIFLTGGLIFHQTDRFFNPICFPTVGINGRIGGSRFYMIGGFNLLFKYLYASTSVPEYKNLGFQTCAGGSIGFGLKL